MTDVVREVVGVGLGAAMPCDDELLLPALHPMASPGFLLSLDVAGEVIVRADAEVGLMHRSAEKLFEVRDYRQAMMLANRHDWLSAACAETTVALAAESALGLVPPERATWARTLLIEAQSVGAALAFLAPLAGPVRGTADALIERITSIQERFTGARVHPSYARVGGVAHAVPEQVLDDYIALAASVDEAAGPLAVAVARDASPHHGVARLTRDQAINLGTSGIVARASGLDLDLRRHDAALAYPELADLLDRTVLSDGDVPARVDMLMAHVRTSTRLVAACATRLRDLGPGPVDVPLPKVLRLPEGSSYAWLEGGLGIAGVLLVSTGEKTPWRMKIRSASFATMQAMTVALTGVPRSQLATAVTSFPIVIGDIDR